MVRRSLYAKYLGGIFLGMALYCEVFVYIIQPLYWPALRCGEEKTCTKILFIADPQIQGDLAVPPPLSYLFNWDSDRYLKSTFQVVMNHLEPDILVYLGDLMDEGSISTMPQFHNYAKRLFSIFETDLDVTQVWLPGDNDIGGENEPIKKDKVEEFERVFKQPSVVRALNISFYKVNGITSYIPKEDNNEEYDIGYKIVVSHYPITNRFGFAQKVNKIIKPNIYFCAHNHESKYVKMDSSLANRETKHFMGNDILTVQGLTNILYEIYVPTCSYRMGTSAIGFGAAVLDVYDDTLQYAVFWSPQRFPYLFLYLALLIFIILYSLMFVAARLFYRTSKNAIIYFRSSDSVPLLHDKC